MGYRIPHSRSAAPAIPMTLHNLPPTKREPLLIAPSIIEAFQLLWQLRDDWLRLAVVPVLATFLLSIPLVLWPQHPLSVLPLLANVFPLALFAGSWLRLLLFGPDSAPGLGLRWTQRESRLLLRWLQLQILIGLGAALPLALVLPMLPSPIGFLLLGAIFCIALFVLLRLAIVLPAEAAGHKLDLATAWTATADCAPALLAIILLLNLPVSFAGVALELLARSAGLAEALPLTLLLLEDALGYLGIALSLIVLARVYRDRVAADGSQRSST